MNSHRAPTSLKRLISTLEAQLRLLRLVDANAELAQQYERLITIAKSEGAKSVLLGNSDQGVPNSSNAPVAELRRLSVDDVESLLNNEETSRRTLEQIAIERFGVPKGSMRMWGSKQRLREKINIMMRNEKTHRTIEGLAKGDTNTN